MFSEKSELSFNDVPKAVAHLINKVDKIETLLNAERQAQPETNQWLNLNDLCKYHPDHPGKTYGLCVDRATLNPLPQKRQKAHVPQKRNRQLAQRRQAQNRCRNPSRSQTVCK